MVLELPDERTIICVVIMNPINKSSNAALTTYASGETTEVKRLTSDCHSRPS